MPPSELLLASLALTAVPGALLVGWALRVPASVPERGAQPPESTRTPCAK